MAAFLGLFYFSREELFTLGVPSLVSVGIMLSSIAFAFAAAASLYIVFHECHAPMNRAAYWHSVLVAAAVAANAICLGCWGLIGLRLWA
jgi:hypothetical protein